MSSHQPFNTGRQQGSGSGAAAGVVSASSASSSPCHGPLVSSSSNAAQSAASAALSEVDHIPSLSAHIGALFLNDEYSDVTLLVGGQSFRAHKVILAARSEYFRALLYGGMRESQSSEIELVDTPLTAFKHLLRYIYTGQMRLGNLRDDLILDILGLAHQYGFEDLESAISDYLRSVLSIHNVCFIYDTASLYQLRPLIASCHTFMDRHATEVIRHESFNTLSAVGIRDILSRDSFCAAEVEIFRAVHEWMKANGASGDGVDEESAAAILSSVRLSLMSTPDLLKVVRPTGLVPPDVMLDAIQSRTESRDMELKYRGYLIPEENVAQPKHGAEVLYGEVKQAMLDGDSKNYDMERGFSRHPIDESQDKGIIIKLGMQCIVNHIKMLLWDRDQRAYSYYIDVSMDQKDWVRVCDHSKYYCRSWQELYFTPRVVKFIRIVGTHNTVNKVFHVVSLEACYTKKPFRLDPNGILIPRNNVATTTASACVIEGVCRSRNALLNGDTSNYDWDSGYTCHQLGSGAIVVQLPQPYALSSMRLLLWDCDDRSYSYYVEVSANQRDWEIVCDRNRENCKSWQTIKFRRRPVVYIKIVGTHNTANEVFHCVHFECPAASLAEDADEEEEEEERGLLVNLDDSEDNKGAREAASSGGPSSSASLAAAGGPPVGASAAAPSSSPSKPKSFKSDSPPSALRAAAAAAAAAASGGGASADLARSPSGESSHSFSSSIASDRSSQVAELALGASAADAGGCVPNVAFRQQQQRPISFSVGDSAIRRPTASSHSGADHPQPQWPDATDGVMSAAGGAVASVSYNVVSEGQPVVSQPQQHHHHHHHHHSSGGPHSQQKQHRRSPRDSSPSRRPTSAESASRHRSREVVSDHFVLNAAGRNQQAALGAVARRPSTSASVSASSNIVSSSSNREESSSSGVDESDIPTGR